MKRNRTCTYKDSGIYFVTTTVAGFRPILNYDPIRQIILENLDFYRRKYTTAIYAYVIMPEHLHLVVDVSRSVKTISDFMLSFKGMTARQIFRNLSKYSTTETSFFKKIVNIHHCNEKRNFQIWQNRFDDVVIDSSRILNQKIDYIHFNPVKRGLVNNPVDYKYSSARNYELDDHSVFRIDDISR